LSRSVHGLHIRNWRRSHNGRSIPPLGSRHTLPFAILTTKDVREYLFHHELCRRRGVHRLKLSDEYSYADRTSAATLKRGRALLRKRERGFVSTSYAPKFRASAQRDSSARREVTINMGGSG
jgi:hypothetical protein